jgi:hypothetical protein
MAKTIRAKAWIGDISYISVKPTDVNGMIFQTKADAKRAGWKHPWPIVITASNEYSGEKK